MMMFLAGNQNYMMGMEDKMNETEIAELYTVTYDKNTGDLFLKMKVIDPVWKQKILRNWQDLKVKLVVEEK